MSQKFYLIIILLAILLGGAGFYIYKNKTVSKNEQATPTGNSITTPEPTTSKSVEQSVNYSVVVKENSSDKTKTDVFLKDSTTGQETFYITLSDIYRNHYHNAEYHNGNLYVIHRTGGDSGYQTNPNWTDELWRYDQQKKGIKLFSNRGLDFRVSEDEKFIAIVGSGDNNVTGENLTFIKNDGMVLKVFSPNQLGLENLSPIKWANFNFWVSDGAGLQIASFIVLNPSRGTYHQYNVESENILFCDLALNNARKEVAYGSFCTLEDDDVARATARGLKTPLSVYNLETKVKKIITTGIAKQYHPVWLDDDTIEYDNPNGSGRISSKISR